MEIITDDVIKTEKNIVHLPLNALYSIKIDNPQRNKVMATIYISNIKQGSWSMEPHSSLLIHRPQNVNKRFYLTTDKIMVKSIIIPQKEDSVNWITPKICPNLKDYKSHISYLSYPYGTTSVVPDQYTLESSFKYSEPITTKDNQHVNIQEITIFQKKPKPFVKSKIIPGVRQYDDFFVMSKFY